MARGWESKSVESQIDSNAPRRRTPGQRPHVSPEQVEKERKRDSLLLQRTRVLHDLERCTDDRYHQTLERGLDFLESELVALGWTRNSS